MIEIVYLLVFSLPIIIGYLYLNRFIKKRGDTPKKRIAFRISAWVHGIALALIILSTILSTKGILLRWGLNWYISYTILLSGIALFLTVSKSTIHYLWWKIYSGIYYWGIAACIPFWFLIAYCVAMIFYNKQVFENPQFQIYDTSSGSIHPKYHNNVIYKNSGPFLKRLSSFQYDGMIWDVYDVKFYNDNAIQIHLRESRTDSLELAKDSVLTVSVDN